MNTSAPHRVLRPGEMLNWYRIERILGRGGFGIIYLATDTNLDHRVAIKEYRVLVSSDICNTDATTGEFHVRASAGVQRFLTEARNLVRFKHPNIVRVMSVFELNDTAYMVMEYEEGLNLRDYLSDRLNVEEDALKRLIVPISHGLTEVHRHGFIHRDIKPANILVRTNGSPVLLDFGSARSAGPVSAGTLTALVSSGYSPLEQYSGGSERHQGPWTDIYALGAVLYFAVSGAEPVDSARRGTALLNGGRDPLLPARLLGADRYSRSFLDAIDWALQLRIADRPASLADWMPSLLGRTLHHVHTRDIRPLHADRAQGQPLRNQRRGHELREHELKAVSLSGQDNRYPLFSVFGRHRRSFAGIVMALAVLMALAWLTVEQSELSAGLQPGNVAAAGSAGGADVVVKPAESAQTQAGQTQAGQTRAGQTRATAEKATAEKELDAVQAAARTVAAKQLAVERAEAEEKARMLSRRIQLAQTLEQASLLLDQGLLDEAEAALDDAAILDRNDVNLKALRGRWRAAFIDSRMPVSDGDFDSVLARFDRLRQALENNDPASMDELTESSNQNELFRLLMSNFARLDIQIDQIRVTNAEKSISANLRIEFMMRANGAWATPSPAYRERTITSRRVEGRWSRIRW